MLLKQKSKKAKAGFKRKKLDVAGTYQEIKVKGGQLMQAGTKPALSQPGSLATVPKLFVGILNTKE